MTDHFLSRRHLLGTAGALAGLVACPAVLRAQSYATKPIRLIVGNAAGGTNDASARLIAPVLAEELGQPVLVENRPGAAGNLGLGLAARAAPDGHTLFCSSSVMLATSHTHVNKPADPVADLEHITMLCDGFFTFSVNADVPARDYAGLLALAKSQPGKLKHGSPGAGGNIHLAAELFKLRAGVEMPAVHYSSAGAIITDVLQNQIQMCITGIQLTIGHINAGKLRGLFVASKEREQLLPSMPTSVELGIKDLERITNWFGLHAPKGTPAGALKQIQAATQKALKLDEVRSKLAAGGFKAIGDSSESFAARILSDDKVFAEAASASKVRIE